MSFRITDITRRDIADYIRINRISWNGRLEETEFLSRIYDLDSLPSYDSRFESVAGDIWQHRVNNPLDWDDNWVFSDDRFQLEKGEDDIFLRFLCEMLHPVVRAEKEEITRLVQAFNDYLKHDGYEIIEKTKISGRPVFSARIKNSSKDRIVRLNDELKKNLNTDYVLSQITAMETAIENSPHIAIGLSKELIETACKSILDEWNIPVNENWNLPQLMKETAKLLKLTPEDIPEEKRGSQTIKQILGSLSSVVHGLCELRNEYGGGHGKEKRFKGLQARHAKLAVSAASTLAIFLLETNELRKPTGA